MPNRKMVETNYEFLKKEEKTVKKYISKGVMSVHFLTWKTMYEYYISERKEGNSKMESYQNTAENYKVSEATVRNMVYWMNSTE